MRNYGKVGTYEGLRVSRCWGIDPDTGTLAEDAHVRLEDH